MAMKTREFLLMVSSKPRNIRPMTPTKTAKSRINVVQKMPIAADLPMSFCLPRDMKRIMMWGIPK